MKVVITGTTSGLGASLKSFFDVQDVIEMNRPRYDLNSDLDAFVTDDFDVYINNAYSGWAQVELLYKLYEKNKNRTCIIVNIGSVSADGNYDYPNPYAVHKSALDVACRQLQMQNTACRVIQFKIGRMDTKMTADKEGPKLSPSWVATEIIRAINMPPTVLVKTVVLDNVGGRDHQLS